MDRKSCLVLFIVAGVVFSFSFSSAVFAELTDGLVMYLDFDELDGDTFKDLSGKGNDGVVEGNLEYVDGKFGKKAIKTDGTRNFVRVKHNDSLDPVDGKVSVMAWINLSGEVDHSGTGYEQLILHWNDNPNEWTYHFAILNYKTDFIMVESDEDWQEAVGATSVPTDEWHHVAGVADGENVKVYLDGELDGTISYDGTCNVIATDIGISCKVRGSLGGVRGIVDETAIWNRPLSEQEIKQAMQGAITASVTPSWKLATTWADIKVK